MTVPVYLGDYSFAQPVRFAFNTDVAGVLTALTGATVTCMRDDQVQTTAGITLIAGSGARSGINLVSLDTTNDAFYNVGRDYAVALQAGTVGTQSWAGYILAEFSIENRSLSRVITRVDSTGSDVVTVKDRAADLLEDLKHLAAVEADAALHLNPFRRRR